MVGECVFPVRSQEFDKLAALLHREARANPYVLQRPGIVEQAKQKRADKGALAFFMPSKTSNDAIAIALVLHLEHHALVGLIGAGDRLGHDAVETSAFKAAKPVFRYARFARCGGQVQRWFRGGK